MEIIPVLDLKGGQVVRARMGQRDQYRPIVTPLSPTSDPLDVARGLMSLHPFEGLYIADLDAIEGRGDHRPVLRRLAAAFPQLALWVDAGVADATTVAALLDEPAVHVVLGSESQADAALLHRHADDPQVVLSLDFRGETFMGPPSILSDPSVWPARIIAMTLARVGSGTGPDIARLRQIRDRGGNRRVYAAGGVRDAADLAGLERAGIAGALIASSLHDGTLTRADLASSASAHPR